MFRQMYALLKAVIFSHSVLKQILSPRWLQAALSACIMLNLAVTYGHSIFATNVVRAIIEHRPSTLSLICKWLSPPQLRTAKVLTGMGLVSRMLLIWRRRDSEGAWELISNKSCHVKWPSDLSDGGSCDVCTSEISILKITPS